MSETLPYLSATAAGDEIPIIPLLSSEVEDLSLVTPAEKNWMDVQGFTAAKNTHCLMAGKDGSLACVFVGLGKEMPMVSDLWWLAGVVASLPAGRYAIAADRIADEAIAAAALGWCLAHYSFDVYKSESATKVRALSLGGVGNLSLIQNIMNAVFLVRDMVNTPAEDMGPETLEAIIQELAAEYGADFNTVKGQALEEGFPAIHAVGRAGPEAPRLLEINWQGPSLPTDHLKSDHLKSDHLKIAIVGKGVCFDTGGLNLKPGGSMALMKKDMGGAAHAVALASLIMAEKLPIEMQLLVPAVENSIDTHAFRPGDIIDTRAGTTVEIGNTDAEGRLVLCDALTFASEHDPDLIIDFATLTGAARVALGPELPATYTNDDAVWDILHEASATVGDPLWRMPLWESYDSMLDSPVADMNNISDGPFAGSITAALYLQRFVSDDISWLHFDTFAWNPSAKSGRPKGGEAQGLRAAFDMIARLSIKDITD